MAIYCYIYFTFIILHRTVAHVSCTYRIMKSLQMHFIFMF